VARAFGHKYGFRIPTNPRFGLALLGNSIGVPHARRLLHAALGSIANLPNCIGARQDLHAPWPMPEAAPTQIDDDIEDQITEVYTGTVCVHYEEWTFLQKFKADWTITELCKEINETVQFEVPIYLVMRGVPLRADWKLTDLMNSGMHFQALPISPGECWEGPQCFKPCHCHEGFSRDRCGKCCCETSNHEGICKCNDDHHRMCSYDSEEEGSNPEDSVSEASSISSCIQIFHDKTALYARILDDQTIGDLHRLLVAANPRLADAEIFQYNSRLPRGLQIHSLRHLREIFI
jgi:hypothetical protein